MLGKTHMALGFMSAILTATLLNQRLIKGEIDSIALVFIIIAALLPDLDMPNSTLAFKFKKLKVEHVKTIWYGVLAILAVLSYLFLRNTPFYSGIILILFVGFVLADKFAKKGYHMLRNFSQVIIAFGLIGGAYYYNHLPLAWVGIILLLLFISKHRGFSHSIFFLALNIYVVRNISIFYLDRDLSIIFGISMLSHLLGDMCTKAGIELLAPLSNKRFRFPFGLKTGGKFENIIFVAAMLASFSLTTLL